MRLELLRRVRAFKGYKQYEIADLIGMTRQCYNLKENGKYSFTIEDVVSISKFLNLSLEDVNEIFFENKISS